MQLQHTSACDTRTIQILYKSLGSDIVEEFREKDAILAGGALTSIYSKQPIRDYDIYFKSGASHDEVFKYFIDRNNGFKLTYASENANTFKYGNKAIQLIKSDKLMFNSPVDLLKVFDFNVCMSAYEFGAKTFHYDHGFFPGLAQKRLTFNSNCINPLGSLWRLQKYINKGYNCDSSEIIKLGLVISKSLQDVDTKHKFAKAISSISPVAYKKIHEGLLNNHESVNIDWLISFIGNVSIPDDPGGESGY